MSKPVLSDLFTFSGRRNRQSYILLMLAQLTAFFIIGCVAFVGVVIVDDGFDIMGWSIILSCVPALVATAVSSWAAGSQRVRDTGHSGAWILLTLLPYVGWVVALGICFLPGTKGANEYGPSCTE